MKQQKPIFHVAIEADNEEELKVFLSAGLEGLTTCKVKGWKRAN